MRAASAALLGEQVQAVTTLTTWWRITRMDGEVLAFTEHDQDLEFSGHIHLASTGYTPSAIEYSDNLAVDNLEVVGFLESGVIDEDELIAGLFDYATILIGQVNWQDLTQGSMILKRGILGEVILDDHGFRAEIRGSSQSLQQPIGEVSTPTCRANLGDARCKVNIGGLTIASTVTNVVSRRNFLDSSRTEPGLYFSGGLLTWTSGANNGAKMEVKRYSITGGTFELALQMPYDIQVGDAYTVYPGCDKTWETCISKFSNAVNFRGEPRRPSRDRLLQLPR